MRPWVPWDNRLKPPMNSRPIAGHRLTDGLRSFVTMNEGSGSLIWDCVRQASGAINHTTVVPVWQDTTPENGGGRSHYFPGNTVHSMYGVDFGDQVRISTNAVTLGCRYMATGHIMSGKDERLVTRQTGISEAGHDWMLSTIQSAGVKLRFRIKTDGGSDTLIGGLGGADFYNIADNVWYTSFAVYDAPNMYLYNSGAVANDRIALVGGPLAAVTSGNVLPTVGRPYNIGGHVASSGRTWLGNIEWAGVWERALSLDEMHEVLWAPYQHIETPAGVYYIIDAGLSAVGSATATAQALAEGTQAQVGVTSATATAQALASGTQTGPGVASATATAQAMAVSTVSGPGVGSATATAQALALGTQAQVGVASATPTAQALAVGTVSGPGVGSATATAQALAEGTQTQVGVASATATAQALASGVLSGDVSAVGSATATAQALAVGTVSGPGVGSATGTAQALALGTQTQVGVGSATATAQALAEGTVSGPGVGSATGTAQALAEGTQTQVGVTSATVTAQALASGVLSVPETFGALMAFRVDTPRFEVHS